MISISTMMGVMITTTSKFHIDSFRFGKVVIDGTAYSKDLIITPEEIRERWWRREGHSLFPEDLEGILDPAPVVLIIGCGALGALEVPAETREWIETRGIELQTARTGAACDLYNELAGSKRVVTGLHLTC